MSRLEKKQIAKQFSRAADTYESVAALQQTMTTTLLDRLNELDVDVEQELTLVDLGCGTGSALEHFASRTKWNLIGIDLAEGMIEQSRARLRCAAADGSHSHELTTRSVNLQVGDLEQTNLPDASVELVFSNAAIQWCNPTAAFAEIKRILKPNGRWFVSSFGPQTLIEWKNAWQAIGDRQPRVHEFVTLDYLTHQAKAAGLTIDQTSIETQPLTFDSVSDMLASIKRLGATNANRERPQGLLGRQIYSRLVQHFENHLARNGELTSTFECLYLSGHNDLR